jgi:replicative DNA helicase
MDKVYDKDGNLVRIINISQVKNKKCLKMVFDNNEEIISDFEHRWLVYTEHNGKKKEMVMTTQEIKDYNDNLNKRTSNRILKIANPKPLNNCNTELPIDPYLLGMWLGDGHSDDAKITQANIKVWEEIRKRGYEIGNDVSQDGTGKATTRTIFGLQSNLRNLKLLRNKHVPEIYLHCSYEQRLDLLRGLMDSDGTYNKTRKRFVMVTTRESQAQYYIEVISSLGVKVTMIKYKKKFNGKIIPCYNVEFTTTNFNPFLCRNQDVILNPKTNKRLYRTIISVEDVDSVPTKCIEVDSTSSTFLCGKTFLVTHNTNKPKNFESHWYTKKMLAPFNSYDDTALIHYYLQLPLYIRLLLKMLENTKYKSIKYLGGIVVLLKEDSTYIEYRIPTDITNKVFKLEISC